MNGDCGGEVAETPSVDSSVVDPPVDPPVDSSVVVPPVVDPPVNPPVVYNTGDGTDRLEKWNRWSRFGDPTARLKYHSAKETTGGEPDMLFWASRMCLW